MTVRSDTRDCSSRNARKMQHKAMCDVTDNDLDLRDPLTLLHLARFDLLLGTYNQLSLLDKRSSNVDIPLKTGLKVGTYTSTPFLRVLMPQITYFEVAVSCATCP